MMKDVIISIKGSDGDENIELMTDGRFGVKNGSYFLTYDETEMLGMGKVKTSIYVKPDSSVIMQRTGAVESRLVVEEGKRSVCAYTDVGELLIGISGESVKTNLTADGGDISMKYTIDSNLKLVSRNTVKISVRGVK